MPLELFTSHETLCTKSTPAAPGGVGAVVSGRFTCTLPSAIGQEYPKRTDDRVVTIFRRATWKRGDGAGRRRRRRRRRRVCIDWTEGRRRVAV